MLELVRVDDNLLHGQVAFSWIRNLHIHIIVIADDEVINNEFAKMTLGLSKPIGVTLKILSIQDAIKYLEYDKNDSKNTMLIVNSIKNIKKIYDHFKEIHSINLGLLRTSSNIVLQYENTYFSQEDVDICAELINRGVEIELRLHFDDKKVYLDQLISSAKDKK